MYASMFVTPGAHQGQRRTPDAPNTESCVLVIHLIWVPETKLRSSARALCTLKSYAIFPAAHTCHSLYQHFQTIIPWGSHTSEQRWEAAVSMNYPSTTESFNDKPGKPLECWLGNFWSARHLFSSPCCPLHSWIHMPLNTLISCSQWTNFSQSLCYRLHVKNPCPHPQVHMSGYLVPSRWHCLGQV